MRRLGTSLMLLAACAFALHTGVVAADFGAVADYVHAGFDAHEHADAVDAAHAHTDGDHLHLAVAGGKHADQKHHGHCKVPCCGTGCTIAVLAFGISLEPARTRSARAPLPLAITLSSTDLKGLKRPPRPLPLG